MLKHFTKHFIKRLIKPATTAITAMSLSLGASWHTAYASPSKTVDTNTKTTTKKTVSKTVKQNDSKKNDAKVALANGKHTAKLDKTVTKQATGKNNKKYDLANHSLSKAERQKLSRSTLLSKRNSNLDDNVRSTSMGQMAGLHLTNDPLALRSSVAFVQELDTNTVLFSKNANAVLPIASITKLMTALVTVEANLPQNETITITDDDVDYEKHSRSRLLVGSQLSRADAIHLALMSSENRAAHALGRTYPGGLTAFVQAMNAKARQLGMHDTRYTDPTGLSSQNVSSAPDLARLIRVAYEQPLIRQFSTNKGYALEINGRTLQFHNTNALVGSPEWDIGLSKTGFISEAGKCLVMQARIEGRPVAIVLLDSAGKMTRIGDANRLKRWLENNNDSTNTGLNAVKRVAQTQSTTVNGKS